MENEKKLVKKHLKITIQEVVVFESLKEEYRVIGKDDDGDDKYGYVTHPTNTEETEREVTIYSQRISSEKVDVNALISHINM